MCSPNAKRKKTLLKRDGNRCFYTGEVMKENEMSVEHLVPTYWGGTNNMQNLVLCKISENILKPRSLAISSHAFISNNYSNFTRSSKFIV